MDIGIIGLPGSGKTTIFNCLTQGRGETSGHGPGGDRVTMGVAKVPDPRLEGLAGIFNPRRVVPAEVRYLDVPFTPRGLGKSEGFGGRMLDHLSKADALLHAVRRFDDPSVPHVEGSVDPERDIATMDLELAYSDLTILDRRKGRLTDSLKGARAGERDALLKEQALVDRIKEGLEGEVSIREQSFSPEERRTLSNYQFLTAKPLLLVLNVGEEELPKARELEEELEQRHARPGVGGAVVCGKLEMELSQLDETEAETFRSALGAGEPAIARILRISFQLLGLVSFFTTASEEVRAWPVPRDAEAVKAAGKIHTDMERGFIRAEVIGYDEILRCGSIAEARKQGLLRLEGKSYKVQDGDV
ncbi:MAG: DUF933 domain-containing protein, partial [Dehalococcoidia bacterium]